MNDAEREAAFIKRSYAEHLKFARRQAVVFGTTSILMIIAFVWIFFQREAMLRQNAEFVKLDEEVSAYKKRAEEAEQKVLSQDQKIEEALKAAEDCRKSKK